MRVVVLLGGESEERDVSLASGCNVADALRQSGHDVVALDPVAGALTRADEAKILAAGVGSLPPGEIASGEASVAGAAPAPSRPSVGAGLWTHEPLPAAARADSRRRPREPPSRSRAPPCDRPARDSGCGIVEHRARVRQRFWIIEKLLQPLSGHGIHGYRRST